MRSTSYPIISVSIAMNVTNHKQRQKINFLFSLRMISVAIVMCVFLLFFRFANYRRM
nr:MAG TPA: hypothetical protein [Caudoviricetes sp.]